jgi:hypothetical protein
MGRRSGDGTRRVCIPALAERAGEGDARMRRDRHDRRCCEPCFHVAMALHLPRRSGHRTLRARIDAPRRRRPL